MQPDRTPPGWHEPARERRPRARAPGLNVGRSGLNGSLGTTRNRRENRGNYSTGDGTEYKRQVCKLNCLNHFRAWH